MTMHEREPLLNCIIDMLIINVQYHITLILDTVNLDMKANEFNGITYLNYGICIYEIDRIKKKSTVTNVYE